MPGKKLDALAGSEPDFQEGAGGLLLLAAAQETGLLPSLETALPAYSLEVPSRLARTTPPSRRMLLLTLLFLGVVGPTRCATR